MEYNHSHPDYYLYTEVPFQDMVGKTFTRIEHIKDGQERIFFYSDKYVYRMMHEQNCCENVIVDEVHGDIGDLIDTPILDAYLSTNEGHITETQYENEHYTWSFYTIRTIKGSVTLKRYGTSNGYYSEEVNFSREDLSSHSEIMMRPDNDGY
jgi:hypothetical protein